MRGLGKGQTLTVLIVDEVWELIQKASRKDKKQQQQQQHTEDLSSSFSSSSSSSLSSSASHEILSRIFQWLVINSLKSERLQHLALMLQQLQNGWRKKAFFTLLNSSSPGIDISSSSSSTKNPLTKSLAALVTRFATTITDETEIRRVIAETEGQAQELAKERMNTLVDEKSGKIKTATTTTTTSASASAALLLDEKDEKTTKSSTDSKTASSSTTATNTTTNTKKKKIKASQQEMEKYRKILNTLYSYVEKVGGYELANLVEKDLDPFDPAATIKKTVDRLLENDIVITDEMLIFDFDRPFRCSSCTSLQLRGLCFACLFVCLAVLFDCFCPCSVCSLSSVHPVLSSSICPVLC
jgi:hypothetical protein